MGRHGYSRTDEGLVIVVVIIIEVALVIVIVIAMPNVVVMRRMATIAL